MRVFKTKWLSRFARREGIADKSLQEAIERAERGLIDADLGGGLIKQRVARAGQGRSGGYRTIVAYRVKQRAVFLYGFAKNERDNIEPDELLTFRSIAADLLAADSARIAEAPSNVCSEDGTHIVRDASVNALSKLNPGQDETNNITPRDGNFANVANPALINTNTWTGAATIHGTSKESPTIPGQNTFVVKLYNDPQRGNIIAVVFPNWSIPHVAGLIPFWARSTSVNVPAARAYMGCP
jgi:hypothetical protein